MRDSTQHAENNLEDIKSPLLIGKPLIPKIHFNCNYVDAIQEESNEDDSEEKEEFTKTFTTKQNKRKKKKNSQQKIDKKDIIAKKTLKTEGRPKTARTNLDQGINESIR